MRDIKTINISNVWQLVNPANGGVFLQAMEGVLSFFITNTLVAPANNVAGTPLPSLEYRTATGYVWVKAATTGRALTGYFSSPGERVLFEGMYSTLQQAFLFTGQTAFPELVTAFVDVIETDTTHPVAASVIYEIAAQFGLALQSINDDLGLKAPLESPAFTGDALAPTREPADNSTHIATTAYADDAANTARTAAEGYADGLVVGLWDDRGTFDATAGAWPTSADNGSGVDGAILKGDIWSISAPGLLTGGITVNVGDVVRALVDGAGNTATDWGVTENNLGYVAENSANKATVLSSPNNTDYPTTQAVVTGLGTREPALPADSLAGKFLREDRTFQSILDVLLAGVSFASGAAVTAADSILVAIGKLQAQASAINTALFTSRGTGNTISAGCEAVNCTSTVVAGTNNVAINCANLTINAAQKETQYLNVRTNTQLNNLLLPRGSTVHSKGNALTVESFFQVTKPSNNTPVLVQDSDGIKPACTIGGNSPTYFNVAVHEITVVCGLGPLTAVRRVTARAGFGVTVTTLGTDVDTGIVFTITENAGRLDIALTGAGGYATSQLTLEVMVRSFYGA